MFTEASPPQSSAGVRPISGDAVQNGLGRAATVVVSSPDGPSPFAPPTAPPTQSATQSATQQQAQPAPLPAQPYAQPAPLPHPDPFAQPAAAVPWTSPAPASRRSTPVVAIIALVAAGLALLVAVGTLVFVIAASGAFDSSYDLTGTAPQVVDGQPYSGARLAAELERVLTDDGSDVGTLTCPETASIDSDASTVCSGDVDGWQERLTVDFQDGEGHFVLHVEDQ